MTETTETHALPQHDIKADSVEGSNRFSTAASLAGFSAFFGFVMLDHNMSIGAGIAVVGIAGMVTAVCYFILRPG
ncbi:MAG TPA: hypothetical protein VHC44_04700 [Verrucomicrobiae bacterium]|nr:hypothetical protein [Verrucomicrobiae bacterium]